MEELFFIIGLCVFGIAIILFRLMKNKLVMPNLMVSIITFTSYTVMLAGIGLTVINGVNTYPTRWLFYMGSCGFLMYEVGFILKKSKEDIIEMISLNTLVMLTGFFASITIGIYQWLFLAISTGCFIKNLIMINNTPKPSRFGRMIIPYVSFTWSLFPIVWLFSPVFLGLLDAGLTALSYLILDLITKIIFGYLSIKNA